MACFSSSSGDRRRCRACNACSCTSPLWADAGGQWALHMHRQLIQLADTVDVPAQRLRMHGLAASHSSDRCCGWGRLLHQRLVRRQRRWDSSRQCLAKCCVCHIHGGLLPAAPCHRWGYVCRGCSKLRTSG